MLKYVSCISNLSRTFIMKKCWILSSLFCIQWDDHVSFFFQFVFIVDYNDWFSYIEPFLHLWDEAYLIMVDDLFDMFLDSVCKYFIEYFCVYIHKQSLSVILFLCWVFMWLGYKGTCGLIQMNWAMFLLILLCEIIWGVLMLTFLWMSCKISHETVWHC